MKKSLLMRRKLRDVHFWSLVPAPLHLDLRLFALSWIIGLQLPELSKTKKKSINWARCGDCSEHVCSTFFHVKLHRRARSAFIRTNFRLLTGVEHDNCSLLWCGFITISAPLSSFSSLESRRSIGMWFSKQPSLQKLALADTGSMN